MLNNVNKLRVLIHIKYTRWRCPMGGASGRQFHLAGRFRPCEVSPVWSQRNKGAREGKLVVLLPPLAGCLPSRHRLGCQALPAFALNNDKKLRDLVLYMHTRWRCPMGGASGRRTKVHRRRGPPCPHPSASWRRLQRSRLHLQPSRRNPLPLLAGSRLRLAGRTQPRRSATWPRRCSSLS